MSAGPFRTKREPVHFECRGYTGIKVVPPDLDSPLRIRRLENSRSLEVTLGREELIITGAQLDEFWRMIKALRE